MGSNRNVPESRTAGGIVLSWAQFGVGIASFVVSLVTPLLMFVNQTNVNLALLNERVGYQEETVRRIGETTVEINGRLLNLDRRLFGIESSQNGRVPGTKERSSWD